MIILDAQMPPALAVWITGTFKISCFSALFLNLRHAEDKETFAFSKTKNAIVITKDDDFVTKPLREPTESHLAYLRKYI